MRINLKLRAVTGYCSPGKAILADNEDLQIKILDKGQLQKRVVLLFNGKTYAADSNKEVTVPRVELQAVNVLQLSERDDEDRVLNSFVVENLYVIPRAKDCSRLIAEREFYQTTFAELLGKVCVLEKSLEDANKRLADLENGKFTMLKFGGKDNENN